MTRPRLLVSGAAAVAVVAVVGMWTGPWQAESPAQSGAIASTTTITTEPVATRTLRHAEEFSATLGYGDHVPLPGDARGTVTWVPAVGTILEPGDIVYRVDERPTYWATGDVPMYRTLTRGAKGADVEQLQRFLVASGYLDDDAAVDGNFGPAVQRAVKAWQDDHDLDDTGRVDGSQLVFAPHTAIRVAASQRIGDPASGGVIEITATDLFVAVEVSSRKKAVFDGSPVIEVELANGTRHPATVESIEAIESQDPFGDQQFGIRLALDAPIGQQPGDVTVDVIDVLADDALAVPVRAIVALSEGGFAVEVVDGSGGRSYQPVELGSFADGWVEIAGDVADGDTVVVAP